MSAKELGQIHITNQTVEVTPAMIGTVPYRVDLAGQLSDQLQTLCRQGNFYKLVGMDITVRPDTTGAINGGAVTGYLRYYNPTRGRCAAFRHAFKSMAEQMKTQGVSMRNNAGYDFRVALSSQVPGTSPPLLNQATLDGTTGLALNHGTPGASVFGVYNSSVLPNLGNTPVADLFPEGFDTLLQSGAGKTDFVLNEGRLFTGNEMSADLTYSEIPFEIANLGLGSADVSFQWRPDPALYVAIMTGNMEIVIQECNLSAGASSLFLDFAFMVSGWKSIMGDPEKKRSSKRRNRKKA